MVSYGNRPDGGTDEKTNLLRCGSFPKVTLRLVISYFNWIWLHSRLGTTAAQRADLTSEPWTWQDLAVYPTLG